MNLICFVDVVFSTYPPEYCRKLGKRNIERLILQIFSAVSAGEYMVTHIANQYGISKAALSRFAGSTWFEKIDADESVMIPDLWKNTAHILAGNPAFMETILTSKMAGRFKEVLRLIDPDQGNTNGE